jgi:hypothetical protein
MNTSDDVRPVLPQNPPFAFPDILGVNADYFKDDAGDVIMMGYCGPTPGGFPMTFLCVVANDVPTNVYPSGEYVYQRYRKTDAKIVECIKALTAQLAEIDHRLEELVGQADALTAERDEYKRLAERLAGSLARECRIHESHAKIVERIKALTAERDRQYDENVHRIFMQAKAERERDALQADNARLRQALAIAGPIALRDFKNHHFILNEHEEQQVAAIRDGLDTLKGQQP